MDQFNLSWTVMDWLEGTKAKRYKDKQSRNQVRHTPISKYVNQETARFIHQFKSPRSSP